MRRKVVLNVHVLSGTKVEVGAEMGIGGEPACRERLACHQCTLPLDIFFSSSNMTIANIEI